MTSWRDLLNGDPLPWLLEEDTELPSVPYFTMREILELSPEDVEIKKARAALMKSGPVSAILANQSPEGWWVKPGAGYSPKYTGTVWSLMFLAQLGTNGSNEMVKLGCEYLLNHSAASHYGFSFNGSASGYGHCLSGNLASALIDLGWLEDKRVSQALDFMARMVTGEGVADPEDKDNPVRYYKSATCGPLFACVANEKQSCAWGAVKVMVAFGKVPEKERSPLVNKAVKKGIEFLLGRDPALAEYPHPYAEKTSGNWFKFGFPMGYVADTLQNLEALLSLGLAGDRRLDTALELVKSKQDAQGRWKMEYSYNGKMWSDIEKKGRASKWVTLRALRVLKMAYPEA